MIFTAPDPEYGFKKKLDLKKHGETKKQLKLKCKVDDPNAKIKWYKDGVEIKPSDTDYLMSVDDEGNVTLTIKCAELKDAGKYTCKIEEFGKEGENETSCQVTIGGTHYIITLEFGGLFLAVTRSAGSFLQLTTRRPLSMKGRC